jgi:hypothetical protein
MKCRTWLSSHKHRHDDNGRLVLIGIIHFEFRGVAKPGDEVLVLGVALGLLAIFAWVI